MNMSVNEAYFKLEKYFEEIADINRIIELLNWDRAVKMPKAGAQARVEQLSTLENIKQKKLASKYIFELIEQAEESKNNLSNWQQANLQYMKKHHAYAVKIPENLAHFLTKTATKCEILWEDAKKHSDFTIVAEELEKLRQATIEKAKIFKKTDTGLYDVMLDKYNFGCTYSEIEPLFTELSQWLPNFLDKVIKQQKKTIEFSEKFSIEKQKKLTKYIAKKIGYLGRIDTSSHPFSMGRIGDVRITNRYTRDEFILYAVLCALHEAGHGLYDMQLPKQYRRQPVGGAFDISMAIHESQSMIWEMQIGHMIEFWEFITPKIIEILELDEKNPAYSPQNLQTIANKVKLGLIRVDADEATYPLHIIMRTKLEKSMIEDDLQIKDLPVAWNDLSQEMLGITPPNDALGCLQDVHWYGGCFGYFPAYLLGAINAAQIYKKMSFDIKELSLEIKRGNFNNISKWLQKNIHKFGCLYSPKELIYKATDNYPQVDIYKEHLKNRYLS